MKNNIVIGTWPLSGDWGPIDISQVIETLEKCYYDYGFIEYDTAPNYGNGFSEFILGKIFSSESKILFNTKVGNSPFNKKSFDIDSIKLSIEQSLYRLNRTSINVLFLHNPRYEIKNYNKILKLLNDYKSLGVIKCIGLSCARGFKYNKYVNMNEFDFIQDDINLLCVDRLYENKSYNYYARSPLASGLLSGKINKYTIFEKTDHRSSWLTGDRLHSLTKRVDILKKLSNDDIISMASRFLIHSPKIFKVIFGVRAISHVERLNDLRNSLPLNDSIIDQIFSLYENDFGMSDEKHLRF